MKAMLALAAANFFVVALLEPVLAIVELAGVPVGDHSPAVRAISFDHDLARLHYLGIKTIPERLHVGGAGAGWGCGGRGGR